MKSRKQHPNMLFELMYDRDGGLQSDNYAQKHRTVQIAAKGFDVDLETIGDFQFDCMEVLERYKYL